MDIPNELRYTTDHEWVQNEEGHVRIGITDFAQGALGDIVYVSLPEIGRTIAKGEALGEVESTKSVSEIYAPIGGEVIATNGELERSPEKVNTEPYGAGWLCTLRPTVDAELNDLLDADAYRELIAE